MPKLSDLIESQKEKKTRFTKKEYRPWNLSETFSNEVAKQGLSAESKIVEKPISKLNPVLVEKKIESNSIPEVKVIDKLTLESRRAVSQDQKA